MNNKIHLKLNKNQYVRNCSTENAYAIRFSKYSNEMSFISKKHSSLIEVDDFIDGEYFGSHYQMIIPYWLFDRLTEGQQESINSIIQENNEEEIRQRESRES